MKKTTRYIASCYKYNKQTGIRKSIIRNRWNGYVIHRWFDLRNDVLLFKIKKITESDAFFVQFRDDVYEEFDQL